MSIETFFNPPWAEPPTEGEEDRVVSNQWVTALMFHTLKGLAIWCVVGVVPFYLGVPWTMTYLFWLQLVPWLLIGAFLSRKLLTNIVWHHMVNRNEIAAMKLKSLFLWIFMYPYFAIIFWASAAL